MTEKDIKELCKFFLDNGNRPLTDEQKEVIKIAIDSSKTMEELLMVAIASNLIHK